MEDETIRPPDEAKVMCLANFDDNFINESNNNYDIEYETALKQSLNDICNDDNDAISQILEESRKEFELLQQIKEIEEMEEIEKIEQLEKRKKEFETLQPKIKKMITYDQPNKTIYEIILSEIDLYINNNSRNYVSLDNKMIDQIFKVLKGIRLSAEEMTIITKLFLES
jgi:hypothetical protein